MKTTFTAVVEKGLFSGLAKVSSRLDRKQMLQRIAGEAAAAIDMAKGLQGHGNWQASVAKLASAAEILVQGVDLAETLPGVRLDNLRKNADSVLSNLRKIEAVVDINPEESRPVVKGCENALEITTEAVKMFADKLNGDGLAKEFSAEAFEKEYVNLVEKLMMRARPKEREDYMRRQLDAYGVTAKDPKDAGYYPKSDVPGPWEPAPEAPGKMRRKVGGKWEYKDSVEVAGKSTDKSLVDANGAKIEKPEEETEEPDEEITDKSFDASLHKAIYS